MANIIEKRLPAKVRDNMRTTIAAALGLFLGLQYNEYINNLFKQILPNTDDLIVKAVILVALTFVVVYFTLWLQKALDGK